MNLKTDCPRVFAVFFLDGLAFLEFLVDHSVNDFQLNCCSIARSCSHRSVGSRAVKLDGPF